jgi:hypothetical protein
MILTSSDLTMSSMTHVVDTEATPTPQILTIDHFQPQLSRLKEEGLTNLQLLDWLLEEGGIQCTLRTLERRLQEWGIRRAGVTQVPITDELAERVNYLFHHSLLSDSQIAIKIAEEDGLQTSANQVQEIRLLFGWHRQNVTPTQSTAQQQVTQQCVGELVAGEGRSFGRRWAITYLRRRGHRARQLDVADALRLFDPEGVTRRVPGLRKKRLENYITAGPDHLWCLDGHDKLAQYGIEIYAAVDAYSRKIIWFYCGSSNRTQLSVLNQYLRAVKARGVYPSFIRTDKGTETILLADAHFSFYIEAALLENWPDEEYAAVRINDCYIYGPSTRNIRVEGLWRQQRYTATGSWISYFKLLSLRGLFEQTVVDKVVLLFIFMPIIRSELQTFVDTHNAHPIRAQPKRAHHVAGVPDELYSDLSRQCGFSPNPEVLADWESQVAHYGESS